MRGFSFLFAGMLALVAAPSHINAKDNDGAVFLTPSSPWNVDYAEQKCRLARVFGEGENRHLLFFEQAAPAAWFGLSVAGPALDRFSSSRPIMVQFGQAQKPFKTEPFFGKIETFGTAIIYLGLDMFSEDDSDDTENIADEPRTSLPEIDITQAESVDTLSFSQRGRNITLQTGNLAAPIGALNTCAQDLLRDWGLDVDRHRKVTRYPEWTNRSAVAKRIAASYPSSAVRIGEQAIIRMRVIVDADGSVADCNIENATDVERLQSPACEMMQMAKFEPALDSDGQPMRSFYITQIVYQMDENR